ncbi:MAG: DNA repair protein RadC [Anaerolineales bacterium]|nr:DNA repair protein RadC [Anaerolineales bacterium]
MLPLFTDDTQPAGQPRRQLLPLRERPVYRVTSAPNTCTTIELLAALIGGTDPSAKAEALLARFGSLHGLARASLADLTAVPGIGENVAARLMAALEISRRLLAPEDERLTIRSPADAAALLQPLLMHREQEFLMALLLDTRNRVIGEPREVYHGSLNTSLIRVGEVFRDAIKANAAAIIVAHNHPSGDPSASPEDVAVTRALVDAGKLLDCAVLDHLVLGSGGVRWVSMKERGLGFNR